MCRLVLLAITTLARYAITVLTTASNVPTSTIAPSAPEGSSK